MAWTTASAAGLFAGVIPGLAQGDSPEPTSTAPLRLPRAVATLIESVVCHRDPERYALLYRLVWRMLHGERHLLEVASDPLVHRLELMAKAVRRDIHKMHAFVRFRRTAGEPERYVAWFEPEHFILEAAAPFFVERFRALDWSILTPIGSAHWNGERLAFGPPGCRADAPGEDAFEAGWRGYYESTFNPARVNPDLMRAHMPKKYWQNLPETAAIPGLVRSAASRVAAMLEQEPTMPTKRTPEKALEAMRDREIKSLARAQQAPERLGAAGEGRDPGGARRGPGGRRDRVRRRAAGRPGGSAGPALRRPGRQALRPRARRRRARPRRGSTSRMPSSTSSSSSAASAASTASRPPARSSTIAGGSRRSSSSSGRSSWWRSAAPPSWR